MTEHDPNEDDARVLPPDNPDLQFMDGLDLGIPGLSLPEGANDLPPGLASCEDQPVPSADSSEEHEVALAVGRALDALAQLTKFLRLPEHVGERLRADLFCAWRRAQRDSGVCEDEMGVDRG